MEYTILPDRSYETTKLLRRSKGVFSKTRRTLTSPTQFCIDLISAPEGFTTAAFVERCSCKCDTDSKHWGTVTPTHNCRNRNPDIGKRIWFDWKPSPLLYKGKLSCKLNIINEQVSTDSENTCPVQRYISDHRPRGLSLQQLDAVGYFFEIIGRRTLSLFLNGTVGYRINSEDSIMSPGCYYRIQLIKVHKTEYVENAVIPDICLERRSTSSSCTVKTEKAVIPL